MCQRCLVQSTPLDLLGVRASDRAYWRCGRLSTCQQIHWCAPNASWCWLICTCSPFSLHVQACRSQRRGCLCVPLQTVAQPVCWDWCCGWVNHSYYTLPWDVLIIALALLQGSCQPMPAHQSLRAHPQGAALRVLDVILHGASLRAGRSPKDAAPRLGACSFSPRRNVLMMACEIIQRYQISAKSDHRSRTTQRCLENRCSL